MKTKDIMSTPVITAVPTTPLKRITELMVDNDISAVPILDDSEDLVGLVSEADIIPMQSIEDPRRSVIPGVLTRGRVPEVASQVMSINVVTVGENEDITQVARLMQNLHLKRVPVVSGRKVTGIITRRDLLKVLARSDASIEAELQELLDNQITLLGWFHAQVFDGVVTLTGPADKSGRKLVETLARSIPGVVAVRFDEAA